MPAAMIQPVTYVTTISNGTAWPCGNTVTLLTFPSSSNVVTLTAWNGRYQAIPQDAAGLAGRSQARLIARDRAAELLGYCLTSDQRATLREHGWFEVRSSKGRRWRIRDRGQSGNVDLMPETGDERLATYCAHPPEGLPDPDAYLAQMLTLITDEDAFLRVANLHYRRPVAA